MDDYWGDEGSFQSQQSPPYRVNQGRNAFRRPSGRDLVKDIGRLSGGNGKAIEFFGLVQDPSGF
jgi:hypothetical protein